MLKRLVLICLVVLPVCLYAQPKDLCKGIEELVADAPGGFKAAKDTIIRINERGITWGSKVQIKGVMAGRILSVMGLRYEGALYQSKDLAAVQEAYEKYKGEISGCLKEKGYELSYGDNFYKGLERLKKLVYVKPAADDAASAPPHITVETDYAKQSGMYTIILYVWQH